MKTIEELEARLETVNVERDNLKQRLLDMVLQRNDVRDKLDICGLDLVTAKRERDEARDTIVVLTTAMAEKDLEIATLTAARAEAAKWKAAFENIRSTNTDLMMQLFDAQEATRAVNISPVLHENAQLRSKMLGLSAEVERLTNELQRERIGIRPVDEVRSDAFRRGAEAMREACARVADAHCVPGTRDVIRSLPIPEEP